MRTFLAVILCFSLTAIAQTPDPIEESIQGSADVVDHAEWTNKLKETYSLTDEQIAEFQSKGMTNAHITAAAALAKASGKSVDQVVEMNRVENKSFSTIAQELGQDPKVASQAVTDMKDGVVKAGEDAKKKAAEEKKALKSKSKKDKGGKKSGRGKKGKGSKKGGGKKGKKGKKK